ncbi:MAG: protein kinase [Deltaproteobacteria bacterium]|nr:protein kinase [Deltaproteobacteria bacterium]
MAHCPVCNSELVNQAEFCPYCGEKLGGAYDPFVGKTINDAYFIEELIGSGAIGRVYLAQQLSLSKPVAIKLLRRNLAENEEVNERFQREAMAASRLTHPNSIAVIDFGESADGDLFLVTEYVRGKALCDLIDEQDWLPADQVASIAIQVCSALIEAHAHKVIHRDIKPENIMIVRQRDGKDLVKVLDFGIAQIQQAPQLNLPRLTRFGMVCGTPEYMSPEQARGENLDERTDIYSLGVVIYEALTGSLPFDGPSAMDIVSMHINDIPEPPSKKCPQAVIPKSMEDLCLKALSKKRDERFSSAIEFQKAIEHALKTMEKEMENNYDSEKAVSDSPGNVESNIGYEVEFNDNNVSKGGFEFDLGPQEYIAPGTHYDQLKQLRVSPQTRSFKNNIGGPAALEDVDLELDLSKVKKHAGNAKKPGAASPARLKKAGHGFLNTLTMFLLILMLLAGAGIFLVRELGSIDLPIVENRVGNNQNVVKFYQLPDPQKDLYRKANMHIINERWKPAARLLRRLLRNQPAFAEAYRQLGMCYLGMGREKQAAAALGKYLKMVPRGARARMVRRVIREHNL